MGELGRSCCLRPLPAWVWWDRTLRTRFSGWPQAACEPPAGPGPACHPKCCFIHFGVGKEQALQEWGMESASGLCSTGSPGCSVCRWAEVRVQGGVRGPRGAVLPTLPLRSDLVCSQQGPQAGPRRPRGPSHSLAGLFQLKLPGRSSPPILARCVCECFNFYSWQKLRHKMDLEGDETSLGICWAAAASFLEWEGHRAGRGWVGPKSLGGGLGSCLLRRRDPTENGLLRGGRKLEAELVNPLGCQKAIM